MLYRKRARRYATGDGYHWIGGSSSIGAAYCLSTWPSSWSTPSLISRWTSGHIRSAMRSIHRRAHIGMSSSSTSPSFTFPPAICSARSSSCDAIEWRWAPAACCVAASASSACG